MFASPGILPKINILFGSTVFVPQGFSGDRPKVYTDAQGGRRGQGKKAINDGQGVGEEV